MVLEIPANEREGKLNARITTMKAKWAIRAALACLVIFCSSTLMAALLKFKTFHHVVDIPSILPALPAGTMTGY